MSSPAHAETLFHLLPANQLAYEAILHPDNRHFVSKSKNGEPGLEVGFHVPSTPRGHVIARLGRNADLILRHSTPENPMSAIHVAFEINQATEFVILSVRSKRASSVSFRAINSSSRRKPQDESPPEEKITGDGVIFFGQNYVINIASYEFKLAWRKLSPEESINVDLLRNLTLQGFRMSLQRLKNVRSRDRPTDYDNTEVLSWHVTRLQSAKGPLFKDVKKLRWHIGNGAFGKVYGAVDQATGHEFAVKVVNLKKQETSQVELARAMLHREIKVMERLHHKHIIEYLGHDHFNTLNPEIYMPLRKGSLAKLVKERKYRISIDNLCLKVMEQALAALDYLASERLVHRDVKPQNILFSSVGEDDYLFQLADFGLANQFSLAKTICGTGYYQAPELWPGITGIQADQSPKMDVWSLFATIIAVRYSFKEFPPPSSHYNVAVRSLRSHAMQSPNLEPMVRLHPDRRASAAQMLVLLFQGRNLTTRRSAIPPIEADSDARGAPYQPRQSSTSRQNTGTSADKPLVVYPPRAGTTIRDRGGIAKQSAQLGPTKASASRRGVEKSGARGEKMPLVREETWGSSCSSNASQDVSMRLVS